MDRCGWVWLDDGFGEMGLAVLTVMKVMKVWFWWCVDGDDGDEGLVWFSGFGRGCFVEFMLKRFGNFCWN